MLIDGLELLESSSIINLVVPNGTAFPVGPDGQPNEGELFYLSSISGLYPIGLYYYDGVAWQTLVNSASLGDILSTGAAVQVTYVGSAPTTNSTTLPAPINGQLVWDTTAKKLYAYDVINDAWTTVSEDARLTTLLTSGDALVTTVEKTWLNDVTGTTSATKVNYLSTAYEDIQAAVDARLQKAGGTMTGSIVIPTGQVVSIADAPLVDTSAANKAYVDSKVSGLIWKDAVVVASTGNIDLTIGGLLIVDGHQTVAGDRVLVRMQSAPAENGIYIVGSGSWARSADFNEISPIDEINSTGVWVEKGLTLAGISWTETAKVVTLGTDAIAFTQFNGASNTAPGIGLVKSGNVLSVALGAGIAELPTLDVGLDLYTGGGLFLTLNGSAQSSDINSQLAIQLDGSTLSRTGAGLTVADGGITSSQLNASLNGSDVEVNSGTLALTNTGVAASTYGSSSSIPVIQVDLKGRVISASTTAFSSSIHLTGGDIVDVSGVTGTPITVSLINSGVVAGTYNNSATHVTPFSVDSKGRLTTVGSALTIAPAFSSIIETPTSLAGYGITDAIAADADLLAIAAITTSNGWLKKTGPATWDLYNPDTLAGYGITDAQPLNTKLTAISGLSGTGLVKLTGSVASLDTSTYLTAHPSVSAAANVADTGFNFIQGLTFDSFGHVESVTTGTIQSATTSQQGVVQLTDNTSTISSILAASATAVASAYSLAASALQRSGGTMVGTLTLNQDPTNDMDAATKQYVDNAITGLDFKASVIAATTGPITLSGLQSIDTHTTLADERILVKNQGDATTNGIYLAKSGPWVRATDADIDREVTTGMYTYVEYGSQAGTGWVLSTTGTISLGFTSLTFTQFNGLASVIAGDGLTKSGNQIDVVTASSSRIIVNSDSIDLATISPALTTGTVFNNYEVDAYGRITTTGNSAYITQNDVITLTGHVTGSGRNAITTTLTTVATAGQAPLITFDQYGRVTSGTILSASDIPALPWSKITSGTPTTLAGYGISDGQPLNTNLTSISGLSGSSGFIKTNGSGTYTVDTHTYLQANQSITLSGDATGTGTTSISVVLANTGVAATAYGSATAVGTFTVDSKGRLTDAGNVTITPAFSSLMGMPSTLAGFGISDGQPLDGDLTSIAGLTASTGWLTKTATNTWSLVTPTTLSGFGITDAVNLAGGTMTGLLILSGDPSDPKGAATRQYVDNAITGLDMKEEVLAATCSTDGPLSDGNITLSGYQYIDSVNINADGIRVLVKNQTNAVDNGIYLSNSSTWTRPADAVTGTFDASDYVFVSSGTVNANSGWLLTTPNPVTVGTSALTFVQFNGLAAVTAGDGLTKNGNILDVVTASSSRIVVNPNSIDLATTAVTLGSYGSATEVGHFTVDAYGRLTNAGNTTITPAFSSITGKPTSLSGYGIADGQPLSSVLTSVAAETTGTGLVKLTSGVASLDTSAYITQNQGFSITGSDITGSYVTGAGSLGLTLATVNSNVGTFGSATRSAAFTVNAKGLITAASYAVITPAFSSITGTPTTLTGYGITDAVKNGGGMSTLLAGHYADIPAFGTIGRIYITTDTYTQYLDTGTSWQLMSFAAYGDVTRPAGGDTFTLATVNSTIGTFGSASSIPVITVNAKGLVTNVSTTSVSIPSGSVVLTGDVTASGTTGTSIATTLATQAGVTPGTYDSATSIMPITVNTKGLITNTGTAVTITPAFSSVTGKPTTLSGYGITDAVNMSALGVASGVATLNGSGKLNTSQIPSALVGAVVYQGVWNATTNSPSLASGVGTLGNYYKVNVAGTTSIDGISQWNLGDTIIFDGTTWDKIDGISNEVTSVAGRTGAVTLSTTDISGISSYALIASPTFTGTPLSTTAAYGTNTTQIATTAFVTTAMGNYQTASVVSAVSTLTSSQRGSFIKMTGGSTFVTTIPTPVGFAGSTFTFWNNSTAAQTLSAAAGVFNGPGTSGISTASIAVNQVAEIISDGTNWILSSSLANIVDGGTF